MICESMVVVRKSHFSLRESSSKSCHGLRLFRRYPIIVAVDILSRIHIVLHDAEVSKISEEKLECPMAVFRVVIEDWWIFAHDV